MNFRKSKFHINLANYFAAQPLFFDGELQKKPHVRKCMEQPWQQTNAELWDEVTQNLCNLDFIQAKACAKQTYDLIKDYNFAFESLPEYQPEKEKERKRLERMDKYTHDLISCAKGKITIEQLEIPESVTPWTQEQIDAEIERINTNPNRADKLKDFIYFTGQESGNLQNYAREFACFTHQQAWNYADAGPVGVSAENFLIGTDNNLLLRTLPSRPRWNPFPEIIKLLNYHVDVVKSVSITPDGKRAISGSLDGTCIFWDLEIGKPLKKLIWNGSSIWSVSLTPDGKSAISGSSDGTCIFWNLESGKPHKVLQSKKEHYRAVVSISPNGKRAISGYWRSSDLIVWDLIRGQPYKIINANTHDIIAVKISADGKLAISGSRDRTCTVWNLESGFPTNVFKAKSPVKSVSITPNCELAISGLFDGTCNVWGLLKGNLIKTFSEHKDEISSVDISPDGKKAYSSSMDGTCIVWNVESAQIIKTLKGHSSSVYDFSVTPDGKRAISGSSDKTCILWDLKSIRNVNICNGHLNIVWTIDIIPDYKRAISGSYDKTCIIWDLERGQPIKSLKGHTGWVKSVCFTPDGKRAISGSEDGMVILWDLHQGVPLNFLRKHSAWINSICLTPDGRRLVSDSGDSSHIIWDLEYGLPLKIVKGRFGSSHSISITPDGKRLITGISTSVCEVWAFDSGRHIKTLKGHKNSVFSVSITPDGKRAISGSADYTCILWDLRKGLPLKRLIGHSDSIYSVCITADGKRAISSSSDGTLIIWDLESGKKNAQYVTSQNIYTAKLYKNNIFGGGSKGNIFILYSNTDLLCPSIGIVTARSIWDFEFKRYLELSADCPLCGHRFAPPAAVLATIEKITKRAGLRPDQSPCLELPDEAWEEPGLLGNCPKCGEVLKFNPFIVGGGNYD